MNVATWVSLQHRTLYFWARGLRAGTHSYPWGARSFFTFPVQVLPGRPCSSADSTIPRCGGTREPVCLAIDAIAAAPWAFIFQDWDCRAFWVMVINSCIYSLMPPWVPAHQTDKNCNFAMKQAKIWSYLKKEKKKHKKSHYRFICLSFFSGDETYQQGLLQTKGWRTPPRLTEDGFCFLDPSKENL